MILPPLLADLPPDNQVCIIATAQRYSVPKLALLAIWAVEGGTMGKASGMNADGTTDHGAFQINSFWFGKFEREFGITPELIEGDFCVNVMTAGWILRYEINRAGGDFWTGVARYHSPDRVRGLAYAEKVSRAAELILKRERGF